MTRPPQERREMPEPSPHWPGGPGAHDDPTPVESALGALKYGAILAAGTTIVFFYLATYSGYVAPRAGASLGQRAVSRGWDRRPAGAVRRQGRRIFR